jgi:hypothetical protein
MAFKEKHRNVHTKDVFYEKRLCRSSTYNVAC